MELSSRSTLEITTNASHALQLASDRDTFPAGGIDVFDLDGRKLSEEDLATLKKAEG